MVVEALLTPSADAARALRTEQRDLLEDGRDVALELRRLVHGDLCGMFDGPTTPGSRPLGAARRARPLRALLVRRAGRPDGVRHRLAAGRAGPDGTSGAVAPSRRGRFFLVVDEAWAILSNLGVARWLQSSWKLSRAFGVSNVAVLHRVSDLRSVGASDSEQVALAQGLLVGLGDPGRLRAVARRARGGGGAALPVGDRDGPPAAAPAGHRPVEGGPAVLPGPAPAQRDGAVPSSTPTRR